MVGVQAVAASAQAPGTFSATGSMAVGRFSHTATVLPNGKVLIAGGNSANGNQASAELATPPRGRSRPPAA